MSLEIQLMLLVCISQVQQAETVEKRKTDRQRVFQPPVESSRPGGSTGSKFKASSESAAHEQGRSWREGDEIDVATIKKKVSKAMKKVCSLVIVISLEVVADPCPSLQKR